MAPAWSSAPVFTLQQRQVVDRIEHEVVSLVGAPVTAAITSVPQLTTTFVDVSC